MYLKNSKIIVIKIGSSLLVDENEVKKIVKDFSKNIKSEVVLLSTIEKKSISQIKAKLISYAS